MKSFNEWRELKETTFAPELAGESPYEGIRRNVVKDRLNKIQKLLKEMARQIGGKGGFGFVPLSKANPQMAEELLESLYKFSDKFASTANAWSEESQAREDKIKRR